MALLPALKAADRPEGDTCPARKFVLREPLCAPQLPESR
jgi:hypothetical protein